MDIGIYWLMGYLKIASNAMDRGFPNYVGTRISNCVSGQDWCCACLPWALGFEHLIHLLKSSSLGFHEEEINESSLKDIPEHKEDIALK